MFRWSKGSWQAIVAFVVVPCVLARVLALVMHVWTGPFVDAEFILVGIAWLWLPDWLAVVAMFWVSAALFIFGIVHTFQIGAADIGVLASGALTLPSVTVAKWILVFLVFGTLCTLAARLLVKRDSCDRRVVVASLALVLIVGFAADYVNGVGPFRNGALANRSKDIWRGDIQLISVPEPGLLRLRRMLRQQEAHRGSGHAMEAASDQLDSLLSQQRPVNVVLVVVESWGRALDDSISNAFRQIYLDDHVGGRYEMRVGEVPFTGSTVYGEARELCHQDLGFTIMNAVPDSLKSCLPWQFRAKGYRTVAVHGNVETLFSRFRWYPLVGLESLNFLPALEKARLPDCEGFIPGTCDQAVAGWIGNQLADRRSTPTFMYWLTLNSHLPLRERTDSVARDACQPFEETRSDPGVCAWFYLIRRVHQAIAALAMRPDIPPTAFVIVGDHAPPFSLPARRREFTQSTVPFFALIPK